MTTCCFQDLPPLPDLVGGDSLLRGGDGVIHDDDEYGTLKRTVFLSPINVCLGFQVSACLYGTTTFLLLIWGRSLVRWFDVRLMIGNLSLWSMKWTETGVTGVNRILKFIFITMKGERGREKKMKTGRFTILIVFCSAGMTPPPLAPPRRAHGTDRSSSVDRHNVRNLNFVFSCQCFIVFSWAQFPLSLSPSVVSFDPFNCSFNISRKLIFRSFLDRSTNQQNNVI